MSEQQPTLMDYISSTVTLALAEDVGPGDLTAGLVPEQQIARARVIAREPCIVCGQPWFNEVFNQLDSAISIEWQVGEGEQAKPEQQLCLIIGPARHVLTGERTALNYLQLLSATATIAHHYTEAVAGTNATILDTRKTIPGLRLGQKYAVQVGGAQNHRIGLYDAILIKENHIASGGGITATVATALQIGGDALIETEVETLDEAKEALQAGSHRLLLDNFSIDGLKNAVNLRDQIAPNISLEASGGITLENIRAVAETGVDFISIGALTKDVKAIDLSMQFELTD